MKEPTGLHTILRFFELLTGHEWEHGVQGLMIRGDQVQVDWMTSPEDLEAGWYRVGIELYFPSLRNTLTLTMKLSDNITLRQLYDLFSDALAQHVDWRRNDEAAQVATPEVD